MITDTCQRFTLGRESRRPAGELIKPSAYDVEEVNREVAADFVRTHHYARECSSRSHTFALYQRGVRVGVAVYGALPSMNAHRKVFGTRFSTKEAVTLGRFVLVDDVPGNGESWFIARTFELLRRKRVVAIESCADPKRGHIGTIYQATNGDYRGRTNRASLYILPDGTCLSNRAASKLTGGERGDARTVAQLVSFGAAAPAPDEDVLAWLRRWRPLLTRTIRHPGNHRYVWCLDPRRAHELISKYGPRRPYPKIGAG